jgi:broad specificity phosphatase PhoE
MERVTTLLLVRHAETDMAGRFCGHSNPELNERGRQQLTGLVSRLSQHAIQRVYTSDLRRAHQTAEAIAIPLGAKLLMRPGLREINFGLWEGLSWNEIEVRSPIEAKNWATNFPNSTAPKGESFQQFESRVRRETAFLLEQATKARVAAVTHAGFIRVALTKCCGMSESEARDRTKPYGAVVTLNADLICIEEQRA